MIFMAAIDSAKWKGGVRLRPNRGLRLASPDNANPQIVARTNSSPGKSVVIDLSD
jgi:hypothetical protein